MTRNSLSVELGLSHFRVSHDLHIFTDVSVRYQVLVCTNSHIIDLVIPNNPQEEKSQLSAVEILSLYLIPGSSYD